jgi:hypothetical protein
MSSSVNAFEHVEENRTSIVYEGVVFRMWLFIIFFSPYAVEVYLRFILISLIGEKN